MKGVSPLIATVLLIAFTISVAAIISIWITSFTKSSTTTVETEATKELVCTYGGISLSDLKYGCGNGRLNGTLTNTRTITLGNLSIQIIFTNASSAKYDLWTSTYNITQLKPRETGSFSISTNSNYDKIRAITNCSAVYDEVISNDVTSTGC